MAQNRISLAQARGNFLTWCVTGYMPLAELCRPLFIAQMTPDGIAVPGEFYIIYSVEESRQLFGAGSVASLMAQQHFDTCPELPLYVAPLADPSQGKGVDTAAVAAGGTAYAVNDTITLPNQVQLTVDTVAAGVITAVHVSNPGHIAEGVAEPTNPVAAISSNGSGTGSTFNLTWGAAGGVKATYTVTFTGPCTNSGVLAWAIIDKIYNIGVIIGEASDIVATDFAAALNNDIDLPFTAEAAGSVVTLTAKNAGIQSNWFVPVWNPQFGDEFPEGVIPSVQAGVEGAGVIEYTTAIPAMACPWDCIALGTEEEIAIEAFIQLVRQNWRCGVQGNFKGGHLFHSKTASAGTIAAYGRDRNNPEEVVVPVRTGYKYPGYVLAAATTSRVCCTGCSDPSRPVQYDNGFLGLLFDSRTCSTIWTSAEKKAFYDAGIMNWDVANSRGLRNTQLWIEEPLTTYKYDPNTGAPDGAWQRVESRYTTVKFVRDLGNWYRHNYASVSLMNDGTRIPQGKRAVTPRILQASIIAWMRGTQFGWTAEPTSETLEKMVRVERTNTFNNCDPNRVNVMIDLDLVNQLARIATSIDVAPEFSCIPPV